LFYFPEGFETIGNLAKENISPNPNAVEERILKLNNQKGSKK